jgi:hypothetical protein
MKYEIKLRSDQELYPSRVLFICPSKKLKYYYVVEANT